MLNRTVYIDLTGKRFGRRVVTKRDGSHNGSPMWVCHCDCGQDHRTHGGALRRGFASSCGCLRREMSAKHEDLTGQRFGKLIVVRESADRPSDNRIHWECVCDCGKTTTVMGKLLRNGKTRSCGCLSIELRTKHGHAHDDASSREYRIYYAMLQRCHNPKSTVFQRYGGRGITVCDRWRDGFTNFLQDMGPCPENGTIDRIDNERGYDPQNCRWASYAEQSRNKPSRNVNLTMNGETMCLMDWSRRYGIHYNTLRQRVRKLGSLELALAFGHRGSIAC